MQYFPIISFFLFVILIDWIAISSRLDDKRIKKACIEPVRAVCTKISYTTTIKHSVKWIVYCTYKYKHNNIKNSTPRIQFPHKPKTFWEGDEVDILVNPNEPSQYVFAHPEFDFRVLFSNVFIGFCALSFTTLIILGAISHILGY